MRESILSVYKKITGIPAQVFDILDAAHATGKARKETAVYIKKMVDSGLLFRVSKGLYSKTSDSALIAGNLPFPSYITGRFALFYYGEGEAPTTIDVTTTLYKKNLKKISIRFHRVKMERFGEFEQKAYGGHLIKIAKKEQALKETKKFGL